MFLITIFSCFLIVFNYRDYKQFIWILSAAKKCTNIHLYDCDKVLQTIAIDNGRLALYWYEREKQPHNLTTSIKEDSIVLQIFILSVLFCP